MNKEWINKWMNKWWISEWINEWMNEWKEEGMNEWINEWNKWWHDEELTATARMFPNHWLQNWGLCVTKMGAAGSTVCYKRILLSTRVTLV